MHNTFSPCSDMTKPAGVAITMMDEIAGRLNLTYTVQSEPPDGQWAELVNGSWTGMTGQLVRMEKDTVINTFALLYDRLSVMDFSVTFSTDSYSAVLRVSRFKQCG
ncbi:hypothetical protein Pcinc_000686 [Petrolisthes cinctipes]|uniref:Ionotropic glutamate receptor L-glutamate and glycine-binding domain-containing protein n=1 Tax=Petrolisthes cinctipes TaxID=88211 RepID=A0AAE1L4S1_PETCI|nr:hypothetical protein Pcinc_000686 [Petrolisthes cinctipes]